MQLVQMLPNSFAVGEKAGASGCRVAEKPIESKAAPGRRGVGRVVEGEHRDHDQRQKQEREKRDQVYHSGAT